VAPKKAKARRRHRRLSAAKALHGNTLFALLLDFQFIEEALKRYLHWAYAITRKRTEGILPCKLDRSEVEKFSFGRLIDEFEKFSDDASLVKELRDLVQHRNYCAHRAFMELAQLKAPVAERHAEAKRLLDVRKRVRSAGDRLIAHLDRVRRIAHSPQQERPAAAK
jgi:hypothetical protein